ncbi:hypothetical protein GW17_00035932 [Ensete ventricosum]|nr:hypothetical protein GW17_00035932 [Ensete ventricosum]
MISFSRFAMEMESGQRLIQTQRSPYSQAGKGKLFRSNPLGSEKVTAYVSYFERQNALRGLRMFNLMVRILMVMSLLDSIVEIWENPIQFWMEIEFFGFSSEPEEHFEIFKYIKGFNVTIVTSANTKDETLPLWSSFLLKDSGETK